MAAGARFQARGLLAAGAPAILPWIVTVRTILHYPDARLREESKPVTAFDDALRALVADMAETMYSAEGAGLAAIQIGEPLRLFIVDRHVAGGAEDAPPVVFCNPEILSISEESQTGDEGCLSFPGIFVPVKRGMNARVRAFDVEGKSFEMDGSELFARALQHETDHLNGRLLVDLVGPVKREIIKRKMRKDARQSRDDERERKRA